MTEYAYHFLCADMRAGSGREKPWTVGERREYKGKTLVLCKCGYHSSPTLYDAVKYAPGPVGCLVEIDGGTLRERDKQVSRIRQLVKAVNMERELRLFACDCAERVLKRERKAGHEPDGRSWEAIRMARAFALGEVSFDELAAAHAANAYTTASLAVSAAELAGYATAWLAASASWLAASASARDAAAAAEVKWQRKRLDHYAKQVGLEIPR